MIISSVVKALKDIVFKPYLLLPMAVVALASIILMRLTSWVVERPISDMILYWNELSEMNFLVVALNNYTPEILTMIGTGLFVTVLSIIATMSLVRFVDRERFMESINDAMKEWGKAVSFTVIVLIIWIIAAAAMFGIVLVSGLSVELAYILLAVLLVIIFIFLVKIVFVFPAMIKEKPKKAIETSWEFTNDKFLKTVAFMIVVFLIMGIISIIFAQAGIYINLDEFDVFTTIGNVFAATFFALAVAHYFNAQ